MKTVLIDNEFLVSHSTIYDSNCGSVVLKASSMSLITTQWNGFEIQVQNIRDINDFENFIADGIKKFLDYVNNKEKQWGLNFFKLFGDDKVNILFEVCCSFPVSYVLYQKFYENFGDDYFENEITNLLDNFTSKNIRFKLNNSEPCLLVYSYSIDNKKINIAKVVDSLNNINNLLNKDISKISDVSISYFSDGDAISEFLSLSKIFKILSSISINLDFLNHYFDLIINEIKTRKINSIEIESSLNNFFSTLHELICVKNKYGKGKKNLIKLFNDNIKNFFKTINGEFEVDSFEKLKIIPKRGDANAHINDDGLNDLLEVLNEIRNDHYHISKKIKSENSSILNYFESTDLKNDIVKLVQSCKMLVNNLYSLLISSLSTIGDIKIDFK